MIGIFKTLDRYCYTQFLTLLAFGTSLPAGLLLFTDEMQRMMQYVRDFGCPIDIFISMTALQLPEIIVRCMPGGVLVGTMLSLYSMIQNREIVALLTSGVSMARIFRPFIMISLFATTLSFSINEFVVPSCLKSTINLTMIAASNRDIPLTRGIKDFKGYKTDAKGNVQQIFLVASRKGGDLTDVTLFNLTDKKNIQITVAPKGFLKSDSWTLFNGNIFNISDDKVLTRQTSQFDKMQITPPDQIKAFMQKRAPYSFELNTAELINYIDSLKAQGKVVPLTTRLDLARRFSDPLACILIALACLPLVLLNNVRRATYSVAYGAVILVGYFTLRSIAGALASNAIVTPELAAWIPSLVIVTISGAFLFLVKNRLN